MDSKQIFKTLSSNKETKKYFIGVYASNELPHSIKKRPACLIANTDPSSRPGSHWIAIYIPSRGKSIFFDSYGREPWDERFQKFLINANNGRKNYFSYNTKSIQSIFSDFCGQYCCVFLYNLCKYQNKKWKSFFKMFKTNDVIHNDRKIKQMFTRYFIKKKNNLGQKKSCSNKKIKKKT